MHVDVKECDTEMDFLICTVKFIFNFFTINKL